MIRRMRRETSLGVARHRSLGIFVLAACFVVGGIDNNALAFDAALKAACFKANRDRMDAQTQSKKDGIARGGIKACMLFISSFAASDDRRDLAAAFGERAQLSEGLVSNWGPKQYGDARPLYEAAIADYTVAIRLVDQPISLYGQRSSTFFGLAVRSDNRADVILYLEQSQSDLAKTDFDAAYMAKRKAELDTEIACVRRGGDLLRDCQH
jgi:hypothetical protein